MTRLFIFILLCWPVTSILAQVGNIRGRIAEISTLQPVPFANVYLSNTTIGTTANTRGEFNLSNIPVGSYELIASSVGFNTYSSKVVIKVTENDSLRVFLTPSAQQMVEVQVKSSRDKTWEKQRKQFEKAFLGNTTTCKLLNSWVIDFTEEQGLLVAHATHPLEIENRELGYRLFFELKKFTSSAINFSIVGNIRFSDLNSPDSTTIRRWTKNREKIYRGSVKCLMKTILDNKLQGSSFLLYKEKQGGRPRSDNFTIELQNNLVPIEISPTVTKMTGINQYQITLGQNIEIHYTNGFTTSGFYKDINYPISWLQTKTGSVIVDGNGNLLNPTDVLVSGSMAENRVSGMLPLDYQPDNLSTSLSSQVRKAERLQEKAYFHTDRPYYSPADTLWFSTYMNYRVPALRDSLSNVLYVDLIAPDHTLARQLVLLIDNGRSTGAFSLPRTAGTYWIRAYTQWMRNYGVEYFFYKPILILPSDRRVDETAKPIISDSLLTISPDLPDYKRNSLVSLTLRLKDTTNRPLAGSFSIAVFNETKTTPLAEPISIKPGLDFSEQRTTLPTEFTYNVEKDITLNGIYLNKEGKTKTTKLTFIPQDMSTILQTTTQPDGRFSLKGLRFFGDNTFIVQPPEGSIRWINREPPELPSKLPTLKLHFAPSSSTDVNYRADTTDIKLLQEVNIKAKKIEQSENSYAQADVVLRGEAISGYATVAEAISAKVLGFKLVMSENVWYLVWTRASGVPTSNGTPNEPNLYIDNVQVQGITVGERLLQLSPTLIDHIEANGPITANQGANGSHGLLNVYLKRTSDKPTQGILTVTAKGFDRSPTFRSAVSTPLPGHQPTLYWNPSVSVHSNQSTVLTFYTLNQLGRYRVVMQGLTEQGNAIHSEVVFVVKE